MVRINGVPIQQQRHCQEFFVIGCLPLRVGLLNFGFSLVRSFNVWSTNYSTIFFQFFLIKNLTLDYFLNLNRLKDLPS